MYEIITYYNTGRACGIYRETLEECFEFIRNHFDGNSVEIIRDSTPLCLMPSLRLGVVLVIIFDKESHNGNI
jgi:hypothetical protein